MIGYIFVQITLKQEFIFFNGQQKKLKEENTGRGGKLREKYAAPWLLISYTLDRKACQVLSFLNIALIMPCYTKAGCFHKLHNIKKQLLITCTASVHWVVVFGFT